MERTPEITEILARLDHENPNERLRAMRSGMQTEAVQDSEFLQRLAGLILDESCKVRSIAYMFLLTLRGQTVGVLRNLVQPLVNAMKDPRHDVRMMASDIVGQLCDRMHELSAHLVAALQDEDKEVRLNALFGLERLGPAAEPAMSGLIALLETPEPEFGNRIIATRVLGAIGHRARVAVPSLLALIDRDEELVRLYAAVALTRIDPENPAALPTLIDGLGTEMAGIRADAVEAIGRLGPRAAAAALTLRAYLHDDDWKARRAHEEPETDISDVVREALRSIESGS